MRILGMGWPEVLVILAIILIIFGPKQLPKLGRAIGKTVRNLKKGIGDEEEGKAADAAQAPASTEVAIVAVESVPAAQQAAPAPAPESAPAPAPAAAAAPKVVKKTVVKKKVE